MRAYEVTYRDSDWSKDHPTKVVVASSVARAAEEMSKRKYLRYSGRVEKVTELYDAVVIAK